MCNVEIIDKTTGTSLPKQYISAVKRGMQKACNQGKIAGQKVSALAITIVGGDSHCVDSSDVAFEKAGRFAIEQAFERGNWSLLEPLMRVYIECPGQYAGEVIQLMHKRHGSIIDTNFQESQEFGETAIASTTFEAPLNSMFNFTSELRQKTQGKGEFTMEFCRYIPAYSETHCEAVEIFLEKQRQEA